ncbi:MAG: BspA family leucine-rich repeat surface protein, partial [Treponema sp.]|nr:BspA family leucine-rich repeat surface protein [Treponema sp.]
MKHFSKITTLVLSVVLVFGFASCKNITNNENTTYKVTYSTDYGPVPTAITVDADTVLTEEQLPVLYEDGMIFYGWYDGDTEAVAGVYKVTKNVTLTAKWSVEKNNIFEQMFADKSYKDTYKNATKFARFTEKPNTDIDYVVKSDDYTKLYLWYDEDAKTIFYYVDEGRKFQLMDASSMFYECYKLTFIDLSGFDTSNVTDMSYMFYDCEALTTLDLSGFDTSNVTDMSYMFYDCEALTTLDVSSFDTSNVTDMGYMFSLCSALTTLDLSGFDTSNVTDMG